MDVYYIVHYDVQNRRYARLTSPATVNYADYIADTFNRLGYNVRIISPVRPFKAGKYPFEEIKIRDGIGLVLFKSFNATNAFTRALRRVYMDFALSKYLRINLKKDDLVVIGHLPSLGKIASQIKKCKNNKVIYQIGEIFGVVRGQKDLIAKEFKFFKNADAYIFSNEKLGELVSNSRPFVVAYGSYKYEETMKPKFVDGKIHCVFAGVFKKDKGVNLAIDCTKYLSERYHVHILGFGTDEEIDLIKDNINSIQNETKCKVTYDGLLLNDDFTNFLSSCHIGLSTQSVNNEYNDFAFPSKILTYMSSKLEVVSSKVSAVYKSKIADDLHFYEGDNPKSLAETIMSINIDNIAPSSLIKKLDFQYMKDLSQILDKVINDEY